MADLWGADPLKKQLSLARSEISCSPLLTMLGFGLAWTFRILYMLSHHCKFIHAVALLWPKRARSLSSFVASNSYILCTTSFWNDPWTLEERGMMTKIDSSKWRRKGPWGLRPTQRTKGNGVKLEEDNECWHGCGEGKHRFTVGTMQTGVATREVSMEVPLKGRNRSTTWSFCRLALCHLGGGS